MVQNMNSDRTVIRGLPTGMYVAKVSDEEYSFHRKFFIIEN
jgi:hypothetical protein